MKTPTIRVLSTLMAGAALIGVVLTPLTAHAQRSPQQEAQRRQHAKNEWRNIGLAAGGLSILGLLKNDKTLTFVGAAGALYSASRYEKDRKSQSKAARARAKFFSRRTFYRDGHRYDRHTVVKNGKKHYQFVRRS